MASYTARGLRLPDEQVGSGRPVAAAGRGQRPGAGRGRNAQHLVNLERPDRFNELLLGLLATTGA